MSNPMRPVRSILLAIFTGCAGLIGYALYLQLVENLLPCPLCVVQRMAYWLIGLTALAGFFHTPETTGRRIYAGLMAVFAFTGGLVALRQAWLVRYPEAFECGISPEEAFLNALPLARWWPVMFEANGDCADVTWKFASLTLPDWSAIFFMILAALSIYVLLVRENQRE
ncbi:Thiol:disulfide interchange protein DsbB [Nitrosospira multiformis ATCC 25196]|uniref:Disulfide bond formation protein B n=2 Tax=Nitrosospira multiformis (strain ATCC 25196 / NCIMB 11849 / C 71) TaxID=323848 RepID=DSBB_NITMU|nr:disulfide bond formation protein B [Nitrosospira multiformis]Q2YA85.1 RecName: Full=Disulfide bond formation protein B; AltName: Full=Disulfide oxidoreductase [Nitrosospira multiformis ATCC 25196]ABB74336.1 disulfide bond formation protein DsbB [Nitrosospira multiformis ATCC 25196]SEF50515.1 Thiol:disulfide interchange protein DsbB [Nitrosospira multiformis ATCC 25196]